VLHWLRQPADWQSIVPLHGLDLEVTATSSALPSVEDLLGRPALPGYGLILLLAWLLGTAAIFRGGRGGEAAPAGFGVDWLYELDAAGRLLRGRGALPEGPKRGELLPAGLGLLPEGPAGVQFMAALATGSSLMLRHTLGSRCYDIALAPTPSGFTCSGRDVTAEAAALAAVESAETAAAEARRQQDGLLASLGHDIRTPMTSIMASCELLLDGELEQEQRVWLERMQASCGALLGMLNGLLAAAGETGGTLLREPVDAGALLQEVAGLLRPQAHDKGLELRTRCDDLLRGQWLLDPVRLRQVVFNLAANAVKFTAGGRVDISASVVEADGQSRLRIAVADTGPGIDPADRERIFERFVRGSGVQNPGGLGLGLALCRDNAALMGGTLTLESAVGVGSEFTFECPVDRAPAQDRLRPFAGRTALIVAAEDAATRAIAGQLSELGLTVEMAPDGYLGLALAERLDAQRGAVDLVVLQSSLPGMSGDAFVLRLRNTAFGRRAALVWLGNDKPPATVDAGVPAPPDPYQVAAMAKQLLSDRPSFAALEPDLARSHGGRVLLAEDDKANQALLAAALKKRGFAVFTAGTGAEAVRLASHGTFDAILMDLQMPEMDGFEAVRRIRALPGQASAVPILALTAMQGTLVRRRCADAGFTTVLDKPVNLERLVSELRQCTGGETTAVPADPSDFVADVSSPFLEEMVAVVGLERARACVAEFVADATKRCRRLGELLPGWEVEAILRSCEEISGMAETCGALALGELLEEIADAANRNDRAAAEALIGRLDMVVSRLPVAMAACLEDVARRWRGDRAA
jgi:signal transduction histidine kinase/DNA-binding response OmpR family regulator